jgi:hypothetical protein
VRETKLNRRFAPGECLGVAEVLDPAGRVCEHLVAMRRMPAARRLSVTMERREPGSSALRQVARVLTAQHARAPRGRGIAEQGSREALRQRWADNIGEARQLFPPAYGPSGPVPADEVDEIERTVIHRDGSRRGLRRRRVLVGADVNRAARVVDAARNGDTAEEAASCGVLARPEHEQSRADAGAQQNNRRVASLHLAAGWHAGPARELLSNEPLKPFALGGDQRVAGLRRYREHDDEVGAQTACRGCRPMQRDDRVRRSVDADHHGAGLGCTHASHVPRMPPSAVAGHGPSGLVIGTLGTGARQENQKIPPGRTDRGFTPLARQVPDGVDGVGQDVADRADEAGEGKEA